MKIGIIFLKNTKRSTNIYIYNSNYELVYFISNRHIKDIEFPRSKKTNLFLKDKIIEISFKKFNELSFTGVIAIYDGFHPLNLKKLINKFLNKKICLINIIYNTEISYNNINSKKYKKKFKKQIFPYSLYFLKTKINIKNLIENKKGN